MRIASTTGILNRQPNSPREPGELSPYQDHLGKIKDIAEIKSPSTGQEFRGFIELGLKRHDFASEALRLAEGATDATRGQRFAIRQLERLAAEQGHYGGSAATLRGGLVVLQEMADETVSSASVGRATSSLLLASASHPNGTRDAYLQGGILTLYSRARMDGSLDLRASLPLKQSPDNPEFMAALLLLDPHWQDVLPRLSRQASENSSPSTSLNELESILKRHGVEKPPRLTALQTSRPELSRLLRRDYEDKIHSFDQQGANRVLEIEKQLDRVDGNTLHEVLEKANQAASYDTSMPSLNEVDKQNYRKRKLNALALSALSIGGLAALAALAYGPTGVPFGALLGALPATTLQNPTFELANRVRESAQELQKSGAYLLALCESPPKAGEVSGKLISREALLRSAAERVSGSRTSLELTERGSVLTLLEQTPGDNVSELFEALHRMEPEGGETTYRRALELIKDLANGKDQASWL